MTALSLPSYYAKRMYELCCRWKDKGFYRTTLKEFRKMMMVEDKFANVSDLR
ncbi:MAG: replication initiation protein, partial [Tannerella sp.]|nr:replication initiation protein [Tannerella sp.]